MKERMGTVRRVVLLTQLCVCVAAPLIFFIVGSKWLCEKYGWGRGAMAIGVLLGVVGGIAGLWSTIKLLLQEAEDKQKPPASFNEHH